MQRLSVAGFLSRWHGFDPRSGHVFVVDQNDTGLTFLRELRLPLSTLMPSTYPHSSFSITRGRYKKLCVLSSRANYIDRATAACRRLSAKFEDRVCHEVSVTDPYGRSLGLLDRNRYYFLHVSHHLYSRGWWTPFQTQYFTENLVVPEIEPGPLDL
jgi:hypothetical protein